MANLIDALDENGKPLGFVKTKDEIHKGGFWHIASWVWIYNSRGEILLQLRAKNKDSHSGQWDISATGHVDSGESPLGGGALREIEEEIGLKPGADELKLLEIKKVSKYKPEINGQENEIEYICLFRYDGKFSDLKLQKEEVEKMEFMPLDQFEKEINNLETYKKYVSHGEHYHKVIKAIRE